MITTLLSGLIGAGPTMTPRGGAPFAAVQASTTRWVATNADSVMTAMYSQAAASATRAGVVTRKRLATNTPAPNINQSQGSTMNTASP